MNNDVVISVENLWKQYRYGVISHRRITQDIQSWWARCCGRKQPNTLISNPASSNQHQVTSIEREDRFWALQDVSFSVKQGEILGIIGRNGAGKSTLLKILSRITAPTRGYARINGRVSSLLEVGTGFHQELTGRENVFLNGAIHGMSKYEISKKFDEIVAFSEIEKFIDTPVKRYSSGMRVRLAFAVAAHLEPEILIIDEVLAVGDAAFQRKCLGKMEDVSKKGRTVLFVSHNVGAIAALCDQAMNLESGKIVYIGITSKVIENYLLNLKNSSRTQDADILIEDDLEKSAQIRRICISDFRGRPTLKHNILNPINIDMDFVVRRPVQNLIAGCTVFGAMGQVLYTTNEMDWTNYREKRMRGIFSKDTGSYRASIQLPAPLLHSGTYELMFALFDPQKGKQDYQRNIFIEVEDFGSFASFPFRRNGVVVLPLQWNVKCTNKPYLTSKGENNKCEC